MRVATWNINNVNKRLALLLAWLDRTRPDVVALQEIKCATTDFPTAALHKAGYSALVVGQRTWNGVAILSRDNEPLPVVTALPGDSADKEARYLEAAIGGVLFACLYLPNGNPQPGPKFNYKLRWFDRLRHRTQELWNSGYPVVLLGDWNVVPTDADIYKPDSWRDDALLQPAPRAAYASILAQGWTDAIGKLHRKKVPFTFWDYRRKRWERDAGLRIDHILVGPSLKLVDAGVDREERGREGPSDHAPVWAQLTVKAPARRKSAAPATKSSAAKPEAPSVSPASSKGPEPLAKYNEKRDFSKTAEPAGLTPKRRQRAGRANGPLQFVIQKHWASRLHYDFRLELDGVMVSWAVPKGPSYDPKVKSMAVHVEDHPTDYNTFEGTIPKGEYGGGKVIIWDRGTWEPVGDPRDGLATGKLMFHLHGQKLAGLWELVRISRPGEKKQDQWMLFKKRGDAWARPSAEYDVITALPDSVVETPLGLVEEREPLGQGVARTAVRAERALAQPRKARLPAKLAPQLATLVSTVPEGDWVIEAKFDGYRILARIEDGGVRLFTRNGNDWTGKLQEVANAVAQLGVTRAWLDGEIVVLNDAGIPDFNRLQNAIDNARSRDIVLFVFDVPYLGDQDLRGIPLAARRQLLKELFEHRESSIVRFSQAFEVAPTQLLGAACDMGLEGLMIKRADAPYISGRTESWLKLKCQHRQEFVVLGFTDRTGAAKEVGSLLLGYYEAGKLLAAGSVGTGWDTSVGAQLHAQLVKLEVSQPPLHAAEFKPGRWSKRKLGAERWVRPALVVEVAFGEWTPDKRIRHAIFRGIRTDKPAQVITRERPVAVQSAKPATKAAPSRDIASKVKITHPDRVIDHTTGLRKIDLARYYESVAEWMLPHLKDRPASLVRAPNGITGQLFFQKHPESKMPGLTELDPSLWPGHDPLLAIGSADALVSAAQMNVVEFHTWNSKVARINQPDRFVLDLDPGEGVTWSMLQEAAELTRVVLTELGLESWLKTSGGKGLHVVVPITPKLAYPEIKAFSQAVVKHMARVIPSKFVAVMGGKNRVGKIFIDYLRNGHGQTTACAFSARSRPGMGVSMPVAWEQLKELKSGAQWNIATAREYLSFQQDDPWAKFWKKRQSIEKGIKILSQTQR